MLKIPFSYPAIPPRTKLTCLGMIPGGGTRGLVRDSDWRSISVDIVAGVAVIGEKEIKVQVGASFTLPLLASSQY